MKKIEDIKNWEDAINQVVNCDCLDLMKLMPDKCVDLVLTDPPYNIGDKNKLTKVGNKFKTNEQAWGEWDSMDNEEYLSFIKKVVLEIFRILKNRGSLVCFFDKFNITYLRDFGIESGFHAVNFYALVKKNPVPNLRQNGFTSGFELAVIFNKNKKERKWNFLRQNEMQNYYLYSIGNKFTDHPTEKPLDPFKRLIKIFTDENYLVFDPFLGSGTTARAAKDLGRRFIRCDISELYCENADSRLKQGVLL